MKNVSVIDCLKESDNLLVEALERSAGYMDCEACCDWDTKYYEFECYKSFQK